MLLFTILPIIIYLVFEDGGGRILSKDEDSTTNKSGDKSHSE